MEKLVELNKNVITLKESGRYLVVKGSEDYPNIVELRVMEITPNEKYCRYYQYGDTRGHDNNPIQTWTSIEKFLKNNIVDTLM